MKRFFGIMVLMVFVIVIGKPAPDFTLEDLEGNKVSLSDFKGKVVLLNFWALWCPPCKAEMPSMEELYQKFKDDGLVVIAVHWGNESKKTLKNFVKKNKLTFFVLIDKDKETVKKYPSRGIPYSIIIDREGIVRETKLGSDNWTSKKWQKYFKELLEEK